MKKKVLLVMMLVFTMTISFAQKFDLKNYKAKIAQKMLKSNDQIGARAAYLLDSTKIYAFDAGDSMLFIKAKNAYLPDGRLKSQSFDVDFLGFFQYYQKQDFFYDKQKTKLISYTNTYRSDDGITYNKFLVDSNFYDNKDRIILTRARNDVKEVRSYSISKYKTPFETADTLKLYEYNDTLGKIILTNKESNVLDAKGNITDQIVDSYNSLNGGFGPKSKFFNQYDAKNLKISATEDAWNDTDLKWEKMNQIKNAYNTNQSIKYSITQSEWDDISQSWTKKDSTYHKYDANGNEINYFIYVYTSFSNQYTLSERNTSKYDSNNNIVRDELSQSDLSQVDYATQYWWSFYKNAVATQDVFSKDFNLKIANPIGENADLTLVSERNGTYQLVAFDMNGRMISQQKISNNETIQTNLPSVGQYLYIVTDANNKPLTMKKVVKL